MEYTLPLTPEGGIYTFLYNRLRDEHIDYTVDTEYGVIQFKNEEDWQFAKQVYETKMQLDSQPVEPVVKTEPKKAVKRRLF